MRDFTITPSGDIYIIANHPGCSYFHEHKIFKDDYMCSDYSYVINPKDDQLTKIDTYTKEDKIPSSIVVHKNNCNDVLVNSNNNQPISSKIALKDIKVKQKYNINCSLTYYSSALIEFNFQLLCDINLSSCDSHCKECELSSVSSILMNCNECSSDY